MLFENVIPFKNLIEMKRFLLILTLFVHSFVFAQDDDDQGGKIPERMTEYVQKRLNLSKAEAERFGPVFLNYYNDLRKTNKEFSGDRLVLQQKIVDLKINYRDKFKNIVGEKKSNDVFAYERDFVEEVKRLRQERLDRGGGGGNRNKKGGLLQ